MSLRKVLYTAEASTDGGTVALVGRGTAGSG
jgi:hypothetical protein